MAYDIKFREKVLEHMRKNNLLPEEVSIATSTVRRWLKNIHPKALNRKPYKLDMEKLKKDVKDYLQMHINMNVLSVLK